MQCQSEEPAVRPCPCAHICEGPVMSVLRKQWGWTGTMR